MRRPRLPITASQRAAILDQYGKVSARELAERYGLDRRQVIRMATHAGKRSSLRGTPPNRRGDEFWARLLAYRLAGVPRREIAEREGVALGTVNAWMDRLWSRYGD